MSGAPVAMDVVMYTRVWLGVMTSGCHSYIYSELTRALRCISIDIYCQVYALSILWALIFAWAPWVLCKQVIFHCIALHIS